MFEKATRMKLRFNYKGICTVEDLWDIPLTKLDSMFKLLNAEFKSQKEESLLETKNEQDSELDLKLSIIRHIVAVRVEERKLKKTETERKAKKEKLLSIISAKQDAALHDMSLEDLTKMFEEI